MEKKPKNVSKAKGEVVFRTEKGTELPLINLKGKSYLQVAHRLVWFREDHPDWAIETEIHSISESEALIRAVIKDAAGKTVATAHKSESKAGFGDFIEKAETGAIGRALAYCGYGTQFTEDLDEGSRIADAPQLIRQKQIRESVPGMPPGFLEDSGFEHLGTLPVDQELFPQKIASNGFISNKTYVFKVLSRHKGKEISSVSIKDLENEVRYWSPKNPDGKLGEDIDAIKSYLESR